jgi:hypothetical protein
MRKVLPPQAKTIDQPGRQAGFSHTLLGKQDVIVDAVVIDDALFGIKDGIAGPRVTVPGLPYAAAVDDETFLLFQR